MRLWRLTAKIMMLLTRLERHKLGDFKFLSRIARFSSAKIDPLSIIRPYLSIIVS